MKIEQKAVLALLEEALALDEAERERWFEERALPAPIQREVERLLGARTLAADAFETQHLGTVSPLASIHEGMQVGAYRLVSLIGAGGMGTVFLAERDDGAYEQSVAIKFTAGGRSGSLVSDQFQRERQILARLTHPNIATLHDAGAHEGTPYVVMEYVVGEPIDEFVVSESCSEQDILRLVLQVCDGVQHAHRSLVVHRDIKPSNILVTPDGVAKVLDFGIAAELDTEEGMASAFTEAFASPEQREGRAQSTSSDVYAIGRLLTELLASRSHPAPKIAKDLRAILDRATAYAPEARYDSAGVLAADINRYLNHETVSAVPASLGYSFKKLIRRSPLLVSMATLALVSLVGGIIGFAYQAREANLGRQLAEVEAQRAQVVTDFFRSVMRSASPDNSVGPDITVRDVMQRASQQLLQASEVGDTAVSDRDLGAIHLGAAMAFDGLGDAQAALVHIDEAITINEQLVSRGDELALGYLAEAYYYKSAHFGVVGELSQSIELARQAESLMAQGHADVSIRGANLAGLGLNLFRAGFADEAERLLIQATELDWDESKPGHVETKAGVFNFLSNLYANTGREAQASAVSEQAIEMFQRTNPNSVGLIVSIANLATSYNKQTRYEEAEAQYAILARKMEGLLKEHDPTRLIIQANRASNLMAYRGAEQSVGEARRAHRAIVEHAPHNARIRGLGEHVLADHLCRLGEVTAGTELARAALANRIASTNERDFYTHQTRLLVAECLAEQDPQQARQLAQQVYSDYLETLGESHAATRRAAALASPK